MRAIPLGTLFGLKTTISPVGIASFVVVVPVSSWLAARMLGLGVGSAVLAGLLASAVMLVSDWLHQWGHSLAARRVGHPMVGAHIFSLFSASIYPPDEPRLPPQVHIRRALGGFWVNVLIGLLFTPLAFYLWPRSGVLGWVTGVTAVWNLFVLGLGALVPIDIPGVFTDDGGTLLRYWRESRAHRDR